MLAISLAALRRNPALSVNGHLLRLVEPSVLPCDGIKYRGWPATSCRLAWCVCVCVLAISLAEPLAGPRFTVSIVEPGPGTTTPPFSLGGPLG